jgi:hypothetical protein
LHPDSHIGGLLPGCPRCREHAEHPEQTLDNENIRRLLLGHTYSALDVAAADKLRGLMATGLRLSAIVKGDVA